MGDWERKDPDDEFNWRNYKTMQVEQLLDKLLDRDDIDHDVFFNCIETCEKAIWKAMKRGANNGNI